VTLFTGSRRNAGSTAEVSIIITGDNGDSEPRLLQRTSSVSFKRTSQDSYLVTTAHSLGSLQYIRVWHDNSGPDPSWFLSEVIIRDVETAEQYFFLCNSWLACDEGDGLVERLIPVASPEELKDFQYLFMQNSTDGFSDGHLWFSIVLRPAQSRFTHAQRVTCCLCLLLCTMLVNAMFFKVPVDAENNVDVDVGPYQFTWHEVMVGIQSSLIVFPINLLIVTIFRRIAVRPTRSSKYLKTNKIQPRRPKKTHGVAISLGDIDMEKNKKKGKNNDRAGETACEAISFFLTLEVVLHIADVFFKFRF
jgi:polycystin 1L2